VADGLGGDVAAVVAPFGPPPAPAHHRQTVRRAWGVPADAPVVVAVGRLHPQKGLDVLLDAAPVLAARVPAVHIVLVGEGPLEGHLRRRIAADGLGGRVHVAGPTTDAGAALVAADVVAVPSLWESGPLVAAEALELGRPVVATPTGFVPELIIDGESGRLVPPRDAVALAAALADLLEAPALAAVLGAAGHRRVMAWQDRDAAVAAVVAVYERVRRHS
jgi:glycosyltransferase involved in cell wall biosynthesis